LQDKDEALEALRDEAGAIGMEGFGRLGVEKLTLAIEEFKASKVDPKPKEDPKEEPKADKPKKPYWMTRGLLKSGKK
jgi:hypothetical protein